MNKLTATNARAPVIGKCNCGISANSNAPKLKNVSMGNLPDLGELAKPQLGRSPDRAQQNAGMREVFVAKSGIFTPDLAGNQGQLQHRSSQSRVRMHDEEVCSMPVCQGMTARFLISARKLLRKHWLAVFP